MTNQVFVGPGAWKSHVKSSDRRSGPKPPDAQQGPRQRQGGHCHGDGVARVAQVAAAAAVGEAGDGGKHLGEAGVIAVGVPDALTDGLPTWRETHTH